MKRANPPAAPGWAHAARRWLGIAVRHRGALVGSAATLAVASAVGLNALSWQTSSHPAPLFSSKPERRDALPRKPEPPAAQLPPARPPAAPPAAAVQPPPPPPPAVRSASARDPAAEPVRPSETGSIAPGKVEPQKSIAAAQRALAKLGFPPGKADGVMGTGTKQAIEKFERSRGLPVSGELGGRTLRELLAKAGPSSG